MLKHFKRYLGNLVLRFRFCSIPHQCSIKMIVTLYNTNNDSKFMLNLVEVLTVPYLKTIIQSEFPSKHDYKSASVLMFEDSHYWRFAMLCNPSTSELLGSRAIRLGCGVCRWSSLATNIVYVVITAELLVCCVTYYIGWHDNWPVLLCSVVLFFYCSLVIEVILYCINLTCMHFMSKIRYVVFVLIVTALNRNIVFNPN